MQSNYITIYLFVDTEGLPAFFCSKWCTVPSLHWQGDLCAQPASPHISEWSLSSILPTPHPFSPLLTLRVKSLTHSSHSSLSQSEVPSLNLPTSIASPLPEHLLWDPIEQMIISLSYIFNSLTAMGKVFLFKTLLFCLESPKFIQASNSQILVKSFLYTGILFRLKDG